jgi:dTDP-4-amino-4,6-dideoxygalactose transaminase
MAQELSPHDQRTYRYRSVLPDMPDPELFLPFLREAHANGWYSNFGPLVLRFEQQLLSFFGGKGETCVTASNATAGLSAAILASGARGPVLVPAFTFPASLAAVLAAGAQPIVVDVDRDSWALSLRTLEPALERTKAAAVMLVAPFGMRRDFEKEIIFCRRRGIPVIIDSAAGLGVPRQGFGANEGVFEVFSMHATKPFAVGEGGAIFAHQNHDGALRAALNFGLRSYNQPGGPIWGFNGKMSEFHAAIGLAQLTRYGEIVNSRQAFVAAYQDRLAASKNATIPSDPSLAPWQIFPILLQDRLVADKMVRAAASAGLEIRRYYRPSLSHWPETLTTGPCPVAEELADRMCALPVRSTTSGNAFDEILEIVLASLDKATRDNFNHSKITNVYQISRV